MYDCPAAFLCLIFLQEWSICSNPFILASPTHQLPGYTPSNVQSLACGSVTSLSFYSILAMHAILDCIFKNTQDKVIEYHCVKHWASCIGDLKLRKRIKSERTHWQLVFIKHPLHIYCCKQLWVLLKSHERERMSERERMKEWKRKEQFIIENEMLYSQTWDRWPPSCLHLFSHFVRPGNPTAESILSSTSYQKHLVISFFKTNNMAISLISIFSLIFSVLLEVAVWLT